MSVRKIELVKDDVTAKPLYGDDVKRDVAFTFDGKKGKLDMSLAMYEAFVALTGETPDGEMLRAELGGINRVTDKTAEIRAWAKAQTNEDGSPKFPNLKDQGRVPEDVKAAYEALLAA